MEHKSLADGKKGLAIGAIVFVVAFAVCSYLGYNLYDAGYKKGYQAGHDRAVKFAAVACKAYRNAQTEAQDDINKKLDEVNFKLDRAEVMRVMESR